MDKILNQVKEDISDFEAFFRDDNIDHYLIKNGSGQYGSRGQMELFGIKIIGVDANGQHLSEPENWFRSRNVCNRIARAWMQKYPNSHWETMDSFGNQRKKYG